MKTFTPSNSQDGEKRLARVQEQRFRQLCQWIDGHLGEPIGWQQLMTQSGLQYQTIQLLFYRYHSLTAMTWIRRKREIAQAEEGRQRFG
jgi:AraC-like DNA-binding protein